MQISPNSSTPPADQEVIQALLIKKALQAETQQQAQLLASAQLTLPLEPESSVVGNYLNVHA